MMLDYHNIITTRRNLMITIFLLFLLIVTEQNNISVINVYTFTINLSKIPLLNTVDKILLFLSIYFFIVYYSFLFNETNILEELNTSLSFKILSKILKSIEKRSIKRSLFFFFYPIIFLIDSLLVKNFAVYFSPILFFYITTYIYMYQKLKISSGYISVFIMFFIMIIFYELWKSLLKKNQVKKTYNPFYEKYTENKKIYLKRKR